MANTIKQAPVAADPVADESMKMQPSEVEEMHDAAEKVRQHDHHLGNLLHQIITRLGHAHGIEMPSETATEKEESDGN